MKIILDTNEYIFGLSKDSGEEASIRLLNVIKLLLKEAENFRLLLPEIIIREVQRNIPKDLESDFYKLIYSSKNIEYDSMMGVPAELFEKYHKEKGLKKGDAFIAAFAEFMEVDYLISENRHIYKDLEIQEFISVNAQEFLKILEESII